MYRCHNIPKTVLRNVLTVTWRPSPIQVCMATVIPFHSCLMFSISRAYHLDPQIAELRQGSIKGINKGFSCESHFKSPFYECLCMNFRLVEYVGYGVYYSTMYEIPHAWTCIELLYFSRNTSIGDKQRIQ